MNIYKKRHDDCIQEQKAFRIGEENSWRMASSISIISEEQGRRRAKHTLLIV